MSLIIPLKKISACSNVLVECIMCFGELEKASSSSSLQLMPLTYKLFTNTKRVKGAYIESFQNFDTLGSPNPSRPYVGTNFIVYIN